MPYAIKVRSKGGGWLVLEPRYETPQEAEKAKQEAEASNLDPRIVRVKGDGGTEEIDEES